MNQKVTNVKLIENGKVEVEITKTIKEKVVLDQNQLLELTQGNQMKSSINSKDGIFGEIKSNYPKTTYDKGRCDDIDVTTYGINGLKELLSSVHYPIKLKIESDKTLNEELVKEAVKKIQDDINKNAIRRKVTNCI